MALRGPEHATPESIRENAEMVMVLTVKNKQLAGELAAVTKERDEARAEIASLQLRNATWAKEEELAATKEKLARAERALTAIANNPFCQDTCKDVAEIAIKAYREVGSD